MGDINQRVRSMGRGEGKRARGESASGSDQTDPIVLFHRAWATLGLEENRMYSKSRGIFRREIQAYQKNSPAK